MDSKYDAINMMRQLKITALDSDTHKTNGMEEIPNNPLENVLFEILNTEIVIPSLQFIESMLGESDVSFCAFQKSKKKDSIQLIFSIPSMSIESDIGNEAIADEVVNTYLKEEKRLAK
ncbi:TPA: hypothetical protein RTV06_002716 [Staphylococcus aureus]|nr:hypothetical protein [Staphylococcus aureus]HDZ6149774.1 hypothetical protein [Staphylococcus aureus]